MGGRTDLTQASERKAEDVPHWRSRWDIRVRAEDVDASAEEDTDSLAYVGLRGRGAINKLLPKRL